MPPTHLQSLLRKTTVCVRKTQFETKEPYLQVLSVAAVCNSAPSFSENMFSVQLSGLCLFTWHVKCFAIINLAPPIAMLHHGKMAGSGERCLMYMVPWDDHHKCQQQYSEERVPLKGLECKNGLIDIHLVIPHLYPLIKSNKGILNISCYHNNVFQLTLA